MSENNGAIEAPGGPNSGLGDLGDSGGSSPDDLAFDGMDPDEFNPLQRAVLLISVFLVASCGLAYEIIGGAVSTYLLGDGVMQFSLTIGVFLSSMGVGSFLSRFVRKRLLRTFVLMEIFIGLVGAAIAPFLLWVYVSGISYVPALVVSLGTIGMLSGMEIPILLRLFQGQRALRLSASAVLGLDYIGGLAASLLVPILLVPNIGTIGASALFGVLNLGVAVIGVLTFPKAFPNRFLRRALVAGLFIIMIPLSVAVVKQDAISRSLEAHLYQDPVVFTRQTIFQRIVLTRWRGDLRLFLNGSLQFASKDEYRYHEGLVHPAMASATRHDRVLVLGGGDGLAVREILKWGDVARVDLVDLDPGMTELARTHPDLARLNKGAFEDPRVNRHHIDALRFFTDNAHEPWDVIIMDLPDPSNSSLSRLYAHSSFRLITKHLAADGVLVSQATSPFFAPAAFWCIHDTISGLPAGGPGGRTLVTYPYRVTVPSFGLWGFVLATAKGFDAANVDISVPTRHVTSALLPSLFAFPPDEMSPHETPCQNTLNNPILARAYREGWARYGE